MANQRNEEAMDLIRKAALMNGKPLQEDMETCQVWLRMCRLIVIERNSRLVDEIKLSLIIMKFNNLD